MRTLIIDRMEGSFAICEDKEQKYFAIERNELPAGATEGSVIDISDDGVLSLNEEKTAARRSRIKSKQNALWE